MAPINEKAGTQDIRNNQFVIASRDMEVVNSVIQQAINHNYRSQSKQKHLYGQLDSYYHNNLINHIRCNNFQTMKENKNAARSVVEKSSDAINKNSGNGLQILDFHESWLQEMKTYKNMCVNSPQMLSLHHHVQAARSYQMDIPPNNKKQGKSKPTSMQAMPINTRRSGRHNRRKDAGSELNTRLRMGISSTTIKNRGKEKRIWNINQHHEECPQNSGNKISNRISKSSNRSRSVRVHLSSKNHSLLAEDQQRTRESSGITRHSHHIESAAKQYENLKKPISNPAYLNLKNISISTTTPQKSNMKVIVNKFHASSLLNSHEQDQKAKILTQNGLAKPTNTACEASYYAANYLSSPNGQPIPTKVYHNSNAFGYGNAEDDPGAAIDEVNSYTDSDSDDEYKGEPFYLCEDNCKVNGSSTNSSSQGTESTQNSKESEESTKKTQCPYYRPNSILSASLFPNVAPYLNFSSHADKGPPIPAQLHKVLKWKLSPVMPKIVKRVVLNSGFRIIKNTTDWTAIWEKHMKSAGFRTIRSHQKYNHMPGSFRIGRKDTMWRSIYHNMKKFGKREFGFMQKSYVLPEDLENLRRDWPKNASRLTRWIVKPPASARGTGIRIVNKWSQFPKDRPLVVQKYIEKPLLVNDNKFDMRLYVALTSINPMRLYMYKEGLVRFAAIKYSSELNCLDERCMHLTNYSINKLSQNYSKNEDWTACQGHKWTLQSLWFCLENRGVDTKRLWATLRNLVIKALISGEAGLNRIYRQNVNFRYNCFELFGFDVLLDENIVPWLLEINISPSLHSELPLDLHVKGPLIQAVLNTTLYQVPPKLSEKQQKEILDDLNLKGPLCNDKRLFTTCLTAEEIRKHNQFTNRSVELREDYLDAILEHLMPDDVRCLIITEDELARCKPLERIFPTVDTHAYLKYIDSPRYYNRLLDAWEHRYGNSREDGIKLLSKLCKENYHLKVPEAALEKEPNVIVTEIDLLHVRKGDMLTTPITKALSSSKSSDTDTHVPRDGDVQKNEDVAQPPLEIKVNQKSSGHVEKSIEVQNDKKSTDV